MPAGEPLVSSPHHGMWHRHGNSDWNLRKRNDGIDLPNSRVFQPFERLRN